MASSLQRAALAKAAFARQTAGSGELDKRSLEEAIEAIKQRDRLRRAGAGRS